MTQQHTATPDGSHRPCRDAPALGDRRPPLHRAGTLQRAFTNKCRSCLVDSSRDIDPGSRVKDFSSYYLCGVDGGSHPKYSVTSHAQPGAAAPRERCFPTCSHRDDLKLSGRPRSPPAPAPGYRPGYTIQNIPYREEFSKGTIGKNTSDEHAIRSLKLCRKPSFGAPVRSTTPGFRGAYRGRSYYETYQFSNTDLNAKKGVKFYNKEREGAACRAAKRSPCKTTGAHLHKPMHLIEEADKYCCRSADHKPIPSPSTGSFDGSRPAAASAGGAARGGRVKSCRRVLYNEGIDDGLVGRHAMASHRPPSPPAARKPSGKDWWRDDVIPCSHSNRSKYHRNCREEVAARCYRRDGCEGAPAAARSGAPATADVPIVLYRAPSVRLPKNVLASIRSMDGKTIL